MRLDKFLKVSRIIKRRTVANEAADGGRISVNGRVVKPSYEVKAGDIVEIKFGDKISRFKILEIPKTQGKNLPQIIEELQIIECIILKKQYENDRITKDFYTYIEG